MKNLNRIFLIVLSVLMVQSFGGVASAQIIPCGAGDIAPTAGAALGSDAQDDFFTVLNAGECYWKVTKIVDGDQNPITWLRVNFYSWVSGNDDTLNYHVDVNNGFTRTGHIYIDGQLVHTVVQIGKCTITPGANPSAAGEVFVTYPACGGIVRVNGAATTPVFIKPGAASYEGLVYGPDEMLYALDPTRGLIDVFVPTASNADAPDDNIYDRSTAGIKFDPLFARFNQTGALIVSGRDSAGGYPVLYIFDNSPPRIEAGLNLVGPRPLWSDTNGTGSLGGITFDVDGAILAVYPAAAEVLRFPLVDAATGTYGPKETLIETVNDALGNSRTANRDVFVATAGGLRRFDQDGVEQSVCASFTDGVVLSVDQSANDTQHLTVWYPTAEVGELWEVPFGYNPCSDPITFSCGSLPADGAVLLATFGAPTGAGPAVVDVALPFTTRAAADFDCGDYDGSRIQGIKPFDLVGDGQGFNSFDAYVEFIPSDDALSCRVAVSSQEYSPVDINAVINDPANSLTPSRPLVLPGDNGRMRVWNFAPLDEPGVLCPTGDPNDPPRYTRNVSAFFKEVNPKLALCHDPGLLTCNLQLMSTLDLEFGDIPDDGKLGGFDPRFSEAFLVDQVPDGAYDGVWCGIAPPVNNEPPWLEANAGSVVPIDIKPVPVGDECGAKTIPNLVAVLDVWYVPANGDPAYQVPFEDLNFTGSGSASPYRAVFHEGQTSKKPYSLNWDTNDGDGNQLPTGEYKLTIFDDTAATLGVTEVYFPPQSVRVILK